MGEGKDETFAELGNKCSRKGFKLTKPCKRKGFKSRVCKYKSSLISSRPTFRYKCVRKRDDKVDDEASLGTYKVVNEGFFPTDSSSDISEDESDNNENEDEVEEMEYAEDRGEEEEEGNVAEE